MAIGTINKERVFFCGYVDMTNISIGANGASYVSFSMGKQGYKCLMVSGCRITNSQSGGANANNVVTAQIDMWGNDTVGGGAAGVRFRNIGNSAAKVDARLFGLYASA